MCDCYEPPKINADGTVNEPVAIPTNTRKACADVMSKAEAEEPWFGIEQVSLRQTTLRHSMATCLLSKLTMRMRITYALHDVIGSSGMLTCATVISCSVEHLLPGLPCTSCPSNTHPWLSPYSLPPAGVHPAERRHQVAPGLALQRLPRPPGPLLLLRWRRLCHWPRCCRGALQVLPVRWHQDLWCQRRGAALSVGVPGRPRHWWVAWTVGHIAWLVWLWLRCLRWSAWN